MISNWFKTKVRFRFCHQLIMKLSRVKGKRKNNNKKIGATFSFSNLRNFWKFSNRFHCQLKQIFVNAYQHFQSYTTFLSKFGHTIKQVCSATLQCRYTEHILWHVSSAVWNFIVRGNYEIHGPKKSYFVW